jgi:hypothetical protein
LGYATRLQELEVARREAEVALANTKKETALLINELANNNNADGAKILAELTCPCGPSSIPLEVRIKKEQQQQ